MNIFTKIVDIMTSQVKKSNVKLPQNTIAPHKITDDNQAIHNGVINEESTVHLRSTSSIRKRC
jgi:hypothetical protein